MPKRREVFISYSHEDKSWLDRLCVHLRPLEREHKIVVWSDTRINPGGLWQSEVAAALASTRVAVLLVSADFLSSEFIINSELPVLLDAAEEEGAIIVPLIVSPCGFARHKGLQKFQSVNLARPLIKLPKGDQEEILEEVAGLIANLLALPQQDSSLDLTEPLTFTSAPAPTTIPVKADLWMLLCEQLQRELDPEEFATWFLPLKVHNEGNVRLDLLFPNSRFLHALKERYQPAVDRALAALGASFEISFVLDEETDERWGASQLEHFNNKYRFNTFVVGRSNEFAYAAASAVAGSPSISYNPLFLYGGVGLGKTHLMHAIGQAICARYPRLRVLYLTAEEFVNQLINSIRFDRMPAFRERFRTIDVLMIDDVQFLANKERTQEEFFHTFNTLFTSQRQIILSSDSSPRNIPTLEERLRSRFEWGLIADVQPPDDDTKMAIIRRKAELEGVHLPEDFVRFISGQVRSNIREMEGLVNRVMVYSSLTGQPVTKELGQESLKDLLSPPDSLHRAREIIKYVARYFDLKIADLKSRSLSREVVQPRKIAMYLCRLRTDLSYEKIGALFKKRRTTVMLAVQRVEEDRKRDSDLERTLQVIESSFS